MLTLQGASLCLLAWLLWKLYRRFAARSPLDRLSGPPSVSFLRGNLPQVFDRHGWDFHQALGDKYGPVVALNALLGTKLLFVHDPKALHYICVKEQGIYEKPPSILLSASAILGDGLLATSGDLHRHQRKLLNPVFSINHMRHMHPIFCRITHQLQKALIMCLKDSKKQEIDMSSWMSRTALELVGQAGLGHSFDPLVENVENPYAVSIKTIPEAFFEAQVFRFILPFCSEWFPRWFLRVVAERITWTPFKNLRESSDTLWTHSRDILMSKKAALEAGDEAIANQIGEGKDILSVLLKENLKASEEDRMSDEELLGHMSTFSFAATDTTSGALSRILHLLALHPDVQDKLRKELKDACADGQELSYDELVSLPYLDAICRETMRLYPPVPFTIRQAREDTILPLSSPINDIDGNPLHEIPIPSGTPVVIGIMASNRSKALWGDDAHEWKPERWLSPLPEALSEARVPGIYSNLMTFLGGGRACIGFKFSQLEMKVVLSMLIENFTFEPPQDKEIVWNIAGIVYPTVGPVDKKLQLPLLVGLVDS